MGAFLAALLYGNAAIAFNLTPIKVDFHPAGQGASQVFKIENDSGEPIAVQVSMVSRHMDIDGRETYREADDQFIVYPPQMVIGPRQYQNVRVTWAGDPDPQSELSYRIIAEQLPVNLSREIRTGVSVNLMIRYLGAVYIVPRKANPDIVVSDIVKEHSDEGRPGLAITVHNRGNTHAVLGDLTVRMEGTDGTGPASRPVTLGPEQLKGMTGENVLAGNSRRFVLPWPEGLQFIPQNARLEYTPWR